MRLVLLSLLFLPSLAHAAVAIPALLALGTGASLVQAALILAVSVYGDAQKRKQQRDARRKANANLQDRLVTNVTTEAPHTYVYGRAKVGSAVVAIFTSGDRDQYKHLVCVHAAHECDGIEEIYIANKPVGPLASNGDVLEGSYFYEYGDEEQYTETTYNATSHVLAYTPLVDQDSGFKGRILGGIEVLIGKPSDEEVLDFTRDGRTLTFSNPSNRQITIRYFAKRPRIMVNVQKHLGVPGDPADAYLMARVPEKWTAAHALPGFCYTVITLDLNQPEFQGGIPEIHVLLRGKKLFDPRTGTRYWSQNNALVAYDYLTGPCCKVASVDLPVSQFITAANVCDESYWFGPRYTFNGTITSDEDRAGVLERMAQSMAGGIVATTWGIFAGKYVAPVMALDQSDVVGALAVNPGMSDADIYNTVRGQFISAETGYIPTDYAPYANGTYLAADGKALATSIDLPFTDSTQRAHNLARIFTEDQRNGYTVKGSFSRKAWKLQIGQRVTLSSPWFGWNAKVFRVTDKSYSPTKAVELTLKEDAESIWDFADAVQVDQTPNSNLPNPFSVASLTGLTCESGTNALMVQQDGGVVSRILFQWSQSANPYVTANGQIEIQWMLAGSGTWQQMQAVGDAVSAYLSPVKDAGAYVIRARSIIPSIGARSAWAYIEHTVIGKTEPPPDVEGLFITNGVLSWPEISKAAVPDLAGYRFRFHYGSNIAWSNATDLHTGLIPGSPWQPELLPPGPITVMCKAVDTTGNESENPAYIFHNFGDTIVQNLILTYDDKAAGFPGEKTNCSVVAGDLLADDSGDLFWSDDNAPFWGKNNDLFWPTTTYLPMTYQFSYLVGQDEVGSRMTLAFDIDAASYSVEYQINSATPFWGNDADLFWGEDNEKFWGALSAYQSWPGAIENIGEVEVFFRVTAQGGIVQGAVSELALQFDVEDESEELNDIAISAAGTVLPITKTYRSIKNIQLTLQDNGGTAVTAKWANKTATGPLIYCYNSAGTKVSGIIDARIQGVKG